MCLFVLRFNGPVKPMGHDERGQFCLFVLRFYGPLNPMGHDERGQFCLFVLRFYGPINPMGPCRARSVYLTTLLLGRLSPLSS